MTILNEETTARLRAKAPGKGRASERKPPKVSRAQIRSNNLARTFDYSKREYLSGIITNQTFLQRTQAYITQEVKRGARVDKRRLKEASNFYHLAVQIILSRGESVERQTPGLGESKNK